jgi:hypothetical protein
MAKLKNLTAAEAAQKARELAASVGCWPLSDSEAIALGRELQTAFRDTTEIQAIQKLADIYERLTGRPAECP